MNYDRIATLLAAGLPASQVATIVGVSAARIAQIIKEESFAPILVAKQAEVAVKDIEEISLAAKYTAAEHLLIEQVMQMAPVSELRDVTNALRVVGERQEKAKTRLNPIQQSGPVINTVVQLTLPSYVMPAIQYNSEKEVIAVGNRGLAPMSSKSVTDMFKVMDTPKEINHVERRIHEVAEGSFEEVIPKSSCSASLITGAGKFLERMAPIPAMA